jgi:hypothetical protein
VQREKSAGLVLEDLKTEPSQAVLPLHEFCARDPEERRELQELEKRIAAQRWAQVDDHALIFSSEDGGMIDPTSFSRTFDRLVKRARVRRITMRLARHIDEAHRAAGGPTDRLIAAVRPRWCQPWVSKDPRP